MMMLEKDHRLKDRHSGRRICRYVLSLVAVLVTASAVVLAGAVHRARKQALAVERLRGAGLTAYYDYQMTDDGLPDRSGSAAMPGPCWPKDLFGVDLFHNVTAVSGPPAPDVACEQIADSALAPLEQLPEVTSVSLTECSNITDAVVPYLLSLKKITYLELEGTSITDVGVTALRGMTTLRYLDLSFTSTTDASVRAIAELPNLESLSVAYTRITDSGLRSLCACKSLRCLMLQSCTVTSAGLAQLECLGRLEQLWLGDIPLRDVDADNLAHIQWCVTGPQAGPPTTGCQDADLDGDGDVDQADFGIFQRCLSGARVPTDPNCAN